MDDGELLKRMKQDEQQAFRILFERYARYAAAAAAKVGGGRLRTQDVEEICSDVFVSLWTKRGSIELAGESLKPYIGVLARNKTLNVLRAEKNVLQEELDENAAALPSAEECCLRQESAEVLMEAVNTLEPSERELFLRRYFYLERVSDIARDKGLNIKTASAQILRARRRLEAVLNETGGAE